MQLEEVSSSEEEETESTPSPPPEVNLDFDIPSPKTYLAKLKARLEKSRSYTNSKSKHPKSGLDSSRRRHLTSPLPFKSSRVPSRNEPHSNDDDDRSSSTSSSSSISLTTIDINRSKRAMSKSPKHSHFSPASKGILGAGRVTAWDQPTIHQSTTGATSLSSRLATHNGTSSVGSDENSDIMFSLQTINGQLGELLCRLGPQPLTSATPLTLPYSRYTPSPATPLVVGDVGTSEHQTSTLLNTSGL